MQLRKSIVLLLIGYMFLASSAFAQQSGDFTYTESGGTITITGYTGTGGAVVIPATIAGMPVVSIGDIAFANISYMISVTIPNSVTSIGSFAFYVANKTLLKKLLVKICFNGLIIYSDCKEFRLQNRK